MSEAPVLLAVMEGGGYAHLLPIYRRLGFQVEIMPSVRNAQSWLKKNAPRVVVAEFSFDPSFRDRMSNLESLLATMQRRDCEAEVIVLIEREALPRLEPVRKRYRIHETLTFPIDGARMEAHLRQLLDADP